MRCDEVRENLGAFVDGELTHQVRDGVATHLLGCAACSHAADELTAMGSHVASGMQRTAPEALWDRIEATLADQPAVAPIAAARSRRWSPMLIAAALVLAAGVGVVISRRGLDMASSAQAATADFGPLLAGVQIDPEKAFRTFVEQYDGRVVNASEAVRHTAGLTVAIPDELPGGYRLQQAYAMKIGDSAAAAARYARDDEMVGVIFHRAIHPEDYGTFRDHPCVVGEHRGHRVEVGDWRLVHLTDATTCHCVLSRLDESRDLPAVLHAIAPDFEAADSHQH